MKGGMATVPRVRKFSTAWWFRCAHTLFWVTMITILIWIYADVKYTDQIEMSAKLELTTGESQKILTSQREHSTTFTLTGAQAALERFQNSLAQRDSVLTLDVSQKFAPGKDITVDTRELLEKAAGLQKRGITIKNIQPADITIHLDSLIRIDNIVVKLDARGAELKSQPSPQTASILVSKSKWNDILLKLDGAPPVLETQQVDLKKYPQGVETIITKEIVPMISGIHVYKVEPEKVSFKVNIINPTETKEIRVRVQVLVPPAWEEEDSVWTQYKLVRNSSATSNWEPDLKIIGLQKDLIPENIYAFIRLTENDKQPVVSWLSREVVVVFPPGKNLELVDPAPKVMFKLQKRISKPNQP